LCFSSFTVPVPCSYHWFIVLVEALQLRLPVATPHGVRSKPSRIRLEWIGRKASLDGNSHVEEHALVLLAIGDGDLL
jgi:hypothetical protein